MYGTVVSIGVKKNTVHYIGDENESFAVEKALFCFSYWYFSDVSSPSSYYYIKIQQYKNTGYLSSGL
jgi:hypothetical protein